MTRNTQHGPEGTLGEQIPVFGDSLHKTAPGLRVGAEFPVLIREIVLEHHCRAVIKWMGERRAAVNPLKAMIRQRERREEWRARSHWMHCRTKVVKKAGNGQGKRACSSAWLRLSLEDLDLESGLRQHDRSGKSVRSGSDDVCALHSIILP